jgi:hypothetical protein
LFYLLQLVFIGVAIVFWRHTQPPGYSIAVLAVVAAAMSLHEGMRGPHKAVWMLLIGGFLLLEIQAIKTDHHDAEVAHKSEIKAIMEQFEAMLKEQRGLSAQQNDFALQSAALLKKVGDTSFLARLRKNNAIRSELADASGLFSGLVNNHIVQMGDVSHFVDAAISHALTPEMRIGLEGKKAQRIKDEEARFQKLYLDNVQPRLVKALRDLLSASGLPAEPDASKLITSYGLNTLDSAQANIYRLKDLRAKLVP